jgi:cytochrome b pre-mRNA-processing protein 3
VLARIFRSGPARAAGAKLYDAVTVQARQPAFYVDLGAPDTTEGRFELYNLHVLLLLHRLRGLDGAAAGETAQALFDTYVGALDNTLREMGVGDLSVGKKMRKLGEAIYGRVKSFDEALAEPGGAALEAMIGRTVYAGAAGPSASALATYVRRAVAALAAQPLDALLEGRPAWPALTA